MFSVSFRIFAGGTCGAGFLKDVTRRQVGSELFSFFLLSCVEVLKYHPILSLLQLLEKDSPELFDLLEDFDFNMSETVELLQFQSRVAKDSPTFTDEASSSI